MTRPLILSPFRRTIGEASYFAAVAHDGQTDKAGRPYVEHLKRVVRLTEAKLRPWCAEGSLAWDEALQIAWLHDVIEDTPYTVGHLHAEGFSHSVVAGVCALTKPVGLSYERFIAGIAEHADLPTILVKLSDNEDNADPERLALLPEKDRVRLSAKYAESMAILQEAAVAKGWKP